MSKDAPNYFKLKSDGIHRELHLQSEYLNTSQMDMLLEKSL
jgi:hypothetical protein